MINTIVFKGSGAACSHESVTTETTKATCIEAGYEVTRCDDCNTEISKIKVEDIVPHPYSSEVTDPTCVAKGFTTYT